MSNSEEKVFRLSYKFRLYPTREQEEYFAKCFGSCRFVYNYFLNARIEAYEKTKETLYDGTPNPNYDPEAKPLSLFDTTKMLTQLKRETVDEEGHCWLKDVDAVSLVYALRHLDAAYQNFFRRVKQGNGKVGFPKFKSRYDSKQSFTTIVSEINIANKTVKLPKIGAVKTRIHQDVKGTPVSATISKNAAGQYYISINVKEAKMETLLPVEKEIGISMGISQWVVTSDGEVYDNLRFAKKFEKKLAREQRRLSRKVGARKGEKASNRYLKQKKKVAKLHNKIANSRSYATHNLTREIVNTYGTIASRDMNAQGMMQGNKAKKYKLNQSITDANWAEINRQLAYKSQWADRTFVLVPKDYPTAQVCITCGYKATFLANDLREEWTCPECQTVHSRKYNGAVNVLEAARDILHEQEEAFITKATKRRRKAKPEENQE